MRSLNGSPQIQNYHQEYANIYSYINVGKEHTIAVTAHYDVSSEDSENCLDNSASVINLINLHNKLLADRARLRYNVLIAFIDAEETTDFKLCGIYHLAHTFDVDQLIDLELTAGGNEILMSKYGDFDIFDYKTYRFPFNNAAVIDYWRQKHPDRIKCRGSACIVLASDEDIEELEATGMCRRFAHCHHPGDTVEKWANMADMDKLVNTIYNHLVDPIVESFKEKLNDVWLAPQRLLQH
jgi:hypothetical protein